MDVHSKYQLLQCYFSWGQQFKKVMTFTSKSLMQVVMVFYILRYKYFWYCVDYKFCWRQNLHCLNQTYQTHGLQVRSSLRNCSTLSTGVLVGHWIWGFSQWWLWPATEFRLLGPQQACPSTVERGRLCNTALGHSAAHCCLWPIAACDLCHSKCPLAHGHLHLWCCDHCTWCHHYLLWWLLPLPPQWPLPLLQAPGQIQPTTSLIQVLLLFY